MKLLMFLLLITTTIFSSNFPKWYTSPPTERFPSKQYFSSVYYSDSNFNKAISGALSEIAKQIKSNVKAKSVYMKSQVQVNDKEDIFSAYSSFSKISSEIELKNFDIVKKEKKGNKYFVFITIEKAKFAHFLREQINSANDKILFLYTNAESEYKAGLIENALKKLVMIKENYPIIFKNYDILNSMGLSEESDKPIKNSYTVNKKIIDMVKNIRVIPLTKKLLLVDVGETINLKFKVVGKYNQPIKIQTALFKENSSFPFKSEFTNDAGEVNAKFVTEFTRNEFKTITIKLFTQFKNETIKTLINSIEGNFQYKTRNTNLPPIKINSLNGNLSKTRNEEIISKVENILILNGFQIDNKSDYSFDISALGEPLNGLTKTFKKVQLNITIKISKNKNTIKNLNYSFIGVGRSLNNAYISSFKNIRINKKDIEEIIKLLK